MPPAYMNPYQQMMGNTMMGMNQQPQPQMNNGIIWVQGIEGAKAYQMRANSNAILMDSETEGRFYIKTADNIGMCNLRIFDYTEVTNTAPPNIDMSAYVTKEELKNILAQMGGVENGEQSVSATKRSTK